MIKLILKFYFIPSLLAIFWVVFLAVPFSLSADRVYLDVDSPTAKRIPIVIPDFKNQGSLGASVGNSSAVLLMRDLDFTGYFQIINSKGYLGRPDEPGSIDFNAWTLTGADLLVKGTYIQDGSQLKMEMRLYDLLQGKLILGKEYLVPAQDYPKAVHRFADDILFLLTGERGPFQTKIAFISTTSGKKEIYSADFDGSNFKRLTNYNSITLTPRWSPRGDEIAYTSYKDGTPALYLLHLPGLQSSKISSRPGVNITPAWYPDGESLAVALNHKGQFPDPPVEPQWNLHPPTDPELGN